MHETLRRKHFLHVLAPGLLIICWLAPAGPVAGQPRVEAPASSPFPPKHAFSSCQSCANCHEAVYQQHMQSMHSQSFANPVFLAQYTQDILPLAEEDRGMFRQARVCVSCHAPVAFKQSGARLVRPDPQKAQASSVTCDFCHTIAGFRSAEPGNANYISRPAVTKLGPFRTRTDWHHEYSELQTRSDFCAICHSVRNRLGLDVKSTYAEWKQSPQAREGIQCQDCHMSVNGFLAGGKPVHASGLAAEMTLGSAPKREKLYTHRFQGARSKSQIEGAMGLHFEAGDLRVSPGETAMLVLKVDNSRTGHKMPSGSVELRFLWLDVYAETRGERVALTPVQKPGAPSFDLTGAHPEIDAMIPDIPRGCRIYRTLLCDAADMTTLAFYDAARILFDNRLEASEVRTELYQLRIPETAPTGPVKLRAVLYYVAYPDAFAARLGLPKAEPIPAASADFEFSMVGSYP